MGGQPGAGGFSGFGGGQGQDGFWGRPDANFEYEFNDLGDMMEEMFGFGSNAGRKKKDSRREKISMLI